MKVYSVSEGEEEEKEGRKERERDGREGRKAGRQVGWRPGALEEGVSTPG